MKGKYLYCFATPIYSAIQVYYAQLLHDHASNNLPNLRACLNSGTEHTSTQVAAELLKHLVVTSAFMYSRLFNNSSVANGSILLFHFYILLLFKKRRKGKCRVLLSCHVYVWYQHLQNEVLLCMRNIIKLEAPGEIVLYVLLILCFCLPGYTNKISVPYVSINYEVE
jgi:hypothetical protein